jgi:hypothetical protein
MTERDELRAQLEAHKKTLKRDEAQIKGLDRKAAALRARLDLTNKPSKPDVGPSDEGDKS